MKAVFFIALIACACAGNTFLGQLRKNYETAKAEFDHQYQVQQDLQAQAEDLAAAAAAAAAGGAAVDSETVVNTINGLTEAAKFWGSFVGNEIFDKENLSKKISELHDKQAQLQKYASTDGQAAMVALNAAIWDINVAIKSIQSLAIQLKKGASNVMMITKIAFKKNQDMLEGREKSIYEAAIRVLVNTLKSGNDNAAVVQEKLYKLSTALVTIETQMKAVSDRLKATAKGKSKEFNDWKKDMRAKVYGGCAASVLFPPAVIACYGVAVGVLETEIAKYKRETENFVREFNGWADTFTGLATMANQAGIVSKSWFGKITDFKNVIQNQYDLITGTEDILWMSHDLRQMISDSLVDLVTECEKVINDTTGRLEEVNESDLAAEFDNQNELTADEEKAAEEVSEEDVKKQISTICQQANSNDEKAAAECVQETIKRLSAPSSM